MSLSVSVSCRRSRSASAYVRVNMTGNNGGSCSDSPCGSLLVGAPERGFEANVLARVASLALRCESRRHRGGRSAVACVSRAAAEAPPRPFHGCVRGSCNKPRFLHRKAGSQLTIPWGSTGGLQLPAISRSGLVATSQGCPRWLKTPEPGP